MDLLTDYTGKSLCHFIETNVSGLLDATLITSDFDWDRKPDPRNPGNSSIARSLPYAGVLITFDHDFPFTVSANILYEKRIEYQIWIAARNHTELLNLTSNCRQCLNTAVNPITSGVGLPLYNFSVVSGSFYANAGTCQIEMSNTEHFGPDDQLEEDNRKYRSVIPIALTAFRDVTATLLENKGRINLTDS